MAPHGIVIEPGAEKPSLVQGLFSNQSNQHSGRLGRCQCEDMSPQRWLRHADDTGQAVSIFTVPVPLPPGHTWAHFRASSLSNRSGKVLKALKSTLNVCKNTVECSVCVWGPHSHAMGMFSVLALPLLLLGISGIIYIYQSVRWLLSKSAVQNKVVVITDAISGLGKECSRVFHAGGARLVLCGRTWEKLEALYDALISVTDPSTTYAPKLILLDITDISCIRDVAKEILNCYGCVDILINNASMKVKGAVQSISLELDKKIMDANYFGPITLTKAILPNMISRRTGQIVLINSIQGKIGIPFRAAYAASKHAAVGFFDCLRAEMEEFDISVSTVSPTFICSYHRQPAPGNWEASIWKFFFRKVSYGVHPVEVAEEILATVSRRKQEVLLANPIPRAAVYIRTFFPELFFAIVASGIREKLKTEEEN